MEMLKEVRGLFNGFLRDIFFKGFLPRHQVLL